MLHNVRLTYPNAPSHLTNVKTTASTSRIYLLLFKGMLKKNTFRIYFEVIPTEAIHLQIGHAVCQEPRLSHCFDAVAIFDKVHKSFPSGSS